MSSSQINTRIAPTPSGFLHLGNIYSFVLTALVGKKENANLLLRIDDLDSDRTRDEYLDDIFNQLDWLKIPIDSGPSSVSDFKKHFSQHLKLNHYYKALEQLKSKTKLYACNCTRSQIQTSSNNNLYPGICRNKNLPFESHQVRILIPEQTIVTFHDIVLGHIQNNLASSMGDFVVLRKNKLPAYQLASVVDDIDQKINLIVRGEDLINSTAAQIYLSQFLGNELLDKDLSKNSRFLHHPLLLESNNKKLSKSHDSLSLKALREGGITSDQIYRYLAQTYGMKSMKATSFKELLEHFALSDLQLRTINKVEL